MSRRLAPALLPFALAACASAPLIDGKVCTTPSGLQASGVTDQATCAQLAEYEEATLQVLAPQLPGLRYRLAHSRVQVLETNGTNAWTDQWGRRVAGLTFCDTYTMQLGTDTWTISAFAHESIHAWGCPNEDLNHEASIWLTGYEEAVNKVYLGQ